MNPEEQIIEWIQSKKVKSFYNTVIEKDLNLDREIVENILVKLTIDDTLKPLYHYDCDCGYNGIYREISELEKPCPQCSKDISLGDVYLEFEIVR